MRKLHLQALLCALAMLASVGFVWGAEPGAGVQLTEGPITGDRLMNTASGLLLVIVAIIGGAWLLRRFGHLPGMGKGVVRIVGGVSLGARERAMLVEVQGDRLLLGVAPGQVRKLHVWPNAAEGEFAEALKDVQGAASETGADTSPESRP